PPPKASPQPTTPRLVATRTMSVSIVVRGRPANSGGGAQWSMGMRSGKASIRSMVIAGISTHPALGRLYNVVMPDAETAAAPRHSESFFAIGDFANAQPPGAPCVFT